MNIILNEKRYVEDLMVNPSKENVTSQNIWLVAKYYRELGCNKGKVVENLEHFLLRNDPTCNLVAMGDMIDRAAKGTGKRKLLQIESIPITYTEIDAVDNLSSVREKRILFTLICLAKLSNEISGEERNWVNYPMKEIFELANMYSVTREKQNLLIHNLYKQGLISFSKRIDNTNIQVKCINYNSDPCLYISDYRNLGNQYFMYKGEPYIQCESCGLIVKRTNRSQKYCQDCAKDINRKKAIIFKQNAKMGKINS